MLSVLNLVVLVVALVIEWNFFCVSGHGNEWSIGVGSFLMSKTVWCCLVLFCKDCLVIFCKTVCMFMSRTLCMFMSRNLCTLLSCCF